MQCPSNRTAPNLKAVLIGAAFLSATLLACHDQNEPRPNIVVILIDTLRADHVDSYGYSRPTTPNIDKLAKEGIVFSRAQSTRSWTKPSVASLFTSRWPGDRATSFGSHLRADLPTLASQLRDAGYFTAAVSGNFVHVNPESGLLRGFDESSALAVRLRPDEGEGFWSHKDPSGVTVQLRPYSASEINKGALAMLERTAGRPFFLYVYMEPHSSDAPPRSFASTLRSTPHNIPRSKRHDFERTRIDGPGHRRFTRGP